MSVDNVAHAITRMRIWIKTKNEDTNDVERMQEDEVRLMVYNEDGKKNFHSEVNTK